MLKLEIQADSGDGLYNVASHTACHQICFFLNFYPLLYFDS